MKYDIHELSLEEKIGQMIIIGLNTETAVKNLEKIIQKYKVGGVLLYKKNYHQNYEEMIELVKRSIEEEVEKCILAAFNKAKNDNVDIFDIGERAYQTKTKEWKKYYSENGDNYLKNCDVEVNVKIKNIN